MQGLDALKDYGRSFFRLALIGALATSLGLAACGRKGPLDPPPGTSLTGDQTAPAPSPAGSQPYGPDGKPLAPGGVNRRIPLDVLLN
ncbi:MAG TPA: lipoprotein [Pseudolabrys sp.]|nr:lipoprotein [Pseudolabrys sp.]